MLGSRKLLIVLCIAPCVLSLVCICAFAAPAEDVTPSVDLLLETEGLEDVVKSPSALAEETFPAQPLLESLYYSYSLSFQNFPYTSPLVTECYQIEVYNSQGGYVWGSNLYGSSVRVETLTVGGVSHGALTWTKDGVNSRYVFPDDSSFRNYTITFISPLSSQPRAGGDTVNGTLVEESLVPDVADSIFDLGDALITFIMSSWLVMIPLAAWLVVLCIGAIRKLVKGV